MPVIFQGHREIFQRTRRDTKKKSDAIAEPTAIGPESVLFRTARSSLANVTSRWGSPLGSLGVSLGAEGPLEFLSRNGVDVIPVERVSTVRRYVVESARV